MLYRECQFRSFRVFQLAILICLGLFLSGCNSTASFLTKGEEYLQKRKFHDALMQFRTAAESDPSSAAAHWGLARAHENLGQFNDTLEELRKTVELDNTIPEAKAKLGTYFLLIQPPMIAEAEKLRNEILEADPNYVEGRLLTASIMVAQGKPDADVIEAVNQAINLDPKRIQSYITLQRLYMTRQKANEAEIAIKRGIAANPSASAGYTEYGRFLMYSARNAEAEEQFLHAITIDSPSIEAREALAEFYVTINQFAKAEQTYLDLVNVQDNSPESRIVLAEFYSKANRKDEAIETLNRIITEAPEYVLARYRVGQLYLERNDPAKVNEQLDALFAINDEDVEGLLLRSRLYLQESKGEEAIKDLETVLRKQPSSREALFLMAQSRLSLGQIDQANAFIADLVRYHPNYLKSGLLKIQTAVTAGETENVLKYSNDLIDAANAAVPSADQDAQAIANLRLRGVSSRGLAHLELGNLKEARYDLEEVVRLSPRSSSAVVNLAKVSIAEKENAAALALYEKALSLDAQNFDAISGVVSMCIALGQTPRAHAKIEEIIAANAGKGSVLAALRYLNSTIFAAEKNTRSAEGELAAALELDPDYLPAYSAYAGLLVEQKRTDEAISQYKKVIEKRPSAQIFTMLGILEENRSNSLEAEKAYRAALEISPDSAIAANNLAWLITDNQGNLDEALQLARLAVTKNQTVAEFFDTLGYVYFKKGLTSPAIEQLRKAVALGDANVQRTGSAPNPGFRVRLGMALAKAGDKDSARREVENSLRSSELLSQRDISEAKSVLASL